MFNTIKNFFNAGETADEITGEQQEIVKAIVIELLIKLEIEYRCDVIFNTFDPQDTTQANYTILLSGEVFDEHVTHSTMVKYSKPLIQVEAQLNCLAKVLDSEIKERKQLLGEF